MRHRVAELPRRYGRLMTFSGASDRAASEAWGSHAIAHCVYGGEPGASAQGTRHRSVAPSRSRSPSLKRSSPRFTDHSRT
jgi:hypothetical protein